LSASEIREARGAIRVLGSCVQTWISRVLKPGCGVWPGCFLLCMGLFFEKSARPPKNRPGHQPGSLLPTITLTKRRRAPLSGGVDGLSQESEQGMRCGTIVPMPRLPPQL
jgi:hypothetical protein